MRVLFTTQSSGVEAFVHVGQMMKDEGLIESFMFVGSDQRWYSEYLTKNPTINEVPFLKEWEIAKKAQSIQLDAKILRYFEDRYGQSLWRAALCDRRLMTGKRSGFMQDYRPRLSEEEILKRLQVAAIEVQKFFDFYGPTHLVGFICTTYIEFLAIQEAYARKLVVLNMRPVRIRDHFAIDSSLYDPPQEVENRFFDLNYVPSDESLQTAHTFLLELQEKTMLYEGVWQLEKTGWIEKIKKWGQLVTVNPWKKAKHYYYDFIYRHDTHSGAGWEYLKFSLLRKWYAVPWIKYKTAPHLVKKEELFELSYAFFPLHLEPEVALLLYAPAMQNQIEVIRTCAESLPAGMKLLVKDHPAGYPRRNWGYYKKLLEIPNVRLADPYLKAKDLIDHSQLVLTIGGSIGLETLCRKKPLIFLGPSVNYRVLCHSTMAYYVENLNKLENSVHHILRHYQYNEKLLLRFLATAIESSYPLNFYSVILGRKEAHQVQKSSYQMEIKKLSAILGVLLKQLGSSDSLQGNLAFRIPSHADEVARFL